MRPNFRLKKTAWQCCMVLAIAVVRRMSCNAVGGIAMSLIYIFCLGSESVAFVIAMLLRVWLRVSNGIGSLCRVMLILFPPITRFCLCVTHRVVNALRRVSAVGLWVEKAKPSMLIFLSRRY